jgi:hypothetical protein
MRLKVKFHENLVERSALDWRSVTALAAANFSKGDLVCSTSSSSPSQYCSQPGSMASNYGPN